MNHTLHHAGSASARRLIPLVAAVMMTVGCQLEERVISMRDPLRGLPGASSPMDSELAAARRRRASLPAMTSRQQSPKAKQTPGKAPADPLRLTSEDGSVTLISRMPRDVIHHLRQTLLHNERDLLLEQVLSERTKQAYADRGLDPQQAVEYLVDRRDDVLALLARMPMGAMTPGLFMNNLGDGVYRIEVTRGEKLRLRKLDVVWEHGACRLLLIS